MTVAEILFWVFFGPLIFSLVWAVIIGPFVILGAIHDHGKEKGRWEEVDRQIRKDDGERKS